MELYFFSAYRLIIVYICTKFYENILEGNKVTERTRFSYQTFKRALFRKKMKMELRFFFFAHRLIVFYISTKFHENILDGIKLIERTRFS